MVFEKKKMQLLARFTLALFLICSLVSYTGNMTVDAGISSGKMTLISVLYPLMNDDAQRQAVFEIIVTDPDHKPYAMKNVANDSDAYVMADAINDKLGSAKIGRETLKTLLQDFYGYQLSNSGLAAFVLDQFQKGLTITDDLYSTYGGFGDIKTKIESYTYEYLLFVNFVQEVKNIYDRVKSQPYNPLYVDSLGRVQVYQDLKDLADIAGLFTDSGRVNDYKERLLGLLDKLNSASYDDEKDSFIDNLAAHGLIDAARQDHTGHTGGGGGGGGSTEGGGAILPPPAAPTIKTNTDGTTSVTVSGTLNSSTGIASAAISESIINQMLSSSNVQSDGIKDIIIEIPKVDGAKGYTVDLPGNVLDNPTETENIKIKTDAGTITLPDNMFANNDLVRNKNVSFTISTVDKSTLSPEMQQKIGDRPVIDLSMAVNGTKIEYNNPNAPVTVTFNYKPTAAELSDPEFLVVWYIDNAGNLVEVPSGRYDPVTGTVSFTTTHFSKFALAYNHKLFIDINNSHWAKKTIEILASKGIAKGITDKTFAPEDNITRGDYIAMLVKALNVDATTNETFADISITDVNFKEIAIAKKLGITKGVGNNMFKPNDYITRQDLFALTDRALTVLKKIKARGTSADLDKFTDNAKIAAYARDSFATMVHEGICIGCDNNQANPLGTTTRAQAATIVYRVYNK